MAEWTPRTAQRHRKRHAQRQAEESLRQEKALQEVANQTLSMQQKMKAKSKANAATSAKAAQEEAARKVAEAKLREKTSMLRQMSKESRAQRAQADRERDEHAQRAKKLEEELAAVQRQLASERKLVSDMDKYSPQPAKEEAECVICLENTRLGLTCSGKTTHFICATCLNAYVSSEAAQEPAHIEKRKGKIHCPLKLFGSGGPDDAEVKDVNSGGWSTAGCDSEPLDDLALVKLLDPEPYRALQAAQQRFIEAAAAREARDQNLVRWTSRSGCCFSRGVRYIQPSSVAVWQHHGRSC